MEKGFNLEVHTFKEKLINNININELPVIVKKQVITEILLELNEVVNQVIKQEETEYQKTIEKENSK